MTFAPSNIPLNISGSGQRVLHSAIPTDLSDIASPTVTDPKVSASFLFENILLTNKGELLSDPNFGVGLRSFLFEPQNSFNDLQFIISEQLATYAEGIEIIDVNVVTENMDIDSVSISIKYLNPDKTIQEYLLNADLTSGRRSVYV